jgi:hypothetical protein
MSSSIEQVIDNAIQRVDEEQKRLEDGLLTVDRVCHKLDRINEKIIEYQHTIKDYKDLIITIYNGMGDAEVKKNGMVNLDFFDMTKETYEYICKIATKTV